MKAKAIEIATRLFWSVFATALIVIVALGFYALTHYLIHCVETDSLRWIPATLFLGLVSFIYRQISKSEEDPS